MLLLFLLASQFTSATIYPFVISFNNNFKLIPMANYNPVAEATGSTINIYSEEHFNILNNHLGGEIH